MCITNLLSTHLDYNMKQKDKDKLLKCKYHDFQDVKLGHDKL